MPKFKFYGSATMTGAWFYITAPDKAAAIRRAGEGDFDELETGNAEVVDCEIDIGAIESMG